MVEFNHQSNHKFDYKSKIHFFKMTTKSRTYARIHEPFPSTLEAKKETRIKSGTVSSVSRQFILNALEKLSEDEFDPTSFTAGWQSFSRPGVIRHIITFNLANNVSVRAEVDMDMLDSPTHEGWQVIVDTILSASKRSKEKSIVIKDCKEYKEYKHKSLDSTEIETMFSQQPVDLAYMTIVSRGEFYIDCVKHSGKGCVYTTCTDYFQEFMYSRYTNFDAEYKKITDLGYKPVKTSDFMECFVLIEDMSSERLYSIYSETILLAIEKHQLKKQHEEIEEVD